MIFLVCIEGLTDQVQIDDNGLVGYKMLVPGRRRILFDSSKYTYILDEITNV